MDRPAPTTTSTSTSTSTSTPPIIKQPTEPPPSQPQPQPQPQPSSSTASPNPNLNPNPPPKPSISAATTITTTPSITRPQTVHRPWQHPHPHSQLPSVSSGPPIPSSSSTTPSISSPRGVALGVPAPSPASFSSSFGHQFVGLNRAPVNVPESVANTNNSQVRQGVMASMASNSQMRPHQQRPVQSSLRPATSSSNTQNFSGHVFIRSTPAGAAGSPVPNASQSTSQSLQSSSQLWLSSASQGKPPLPSPSYRPQMNSPSLQQRSHIPPQHHSPPTTSQQQHMSPAQPQQLLQSHQQPEHYGQQFPPSRVQQSLSPLQQVSRVQGSVNHKPSSLAMSHPNTVQPLPQNSIANAESDESGNRILSKRSIHELVSQIDPSEKFNPEVVEILADIADEFLVSVTTFGCSLAKHRKSDTLEAKDILLHLDRNWNMTLPGFCGDEIKSYRKQITNDIHKERLAAIKKSILASEMANAKNTVGQAAGNAKSSTTKTLSNPIVSPNLKVT